MGCSDLNGLWGGVTGGEASQEEAGLWRPALSLSLLCPCPCPGAEPQAESCS